MYTIWLYLVQRFKRDLRFGKAKGLINDADGFSDPSILDDLPQGERWQQLQELYALMAATNLDSNPLCC